MDTSIPKLQLLPDKTGCDHNTNGPSREVRGFTFQRCTVCGREVVYQPDGSIRWVVKMTNDPERLTHFEHVAADPTHVIKRVDAFSIVSHADGLTVFLTEGGEEVDRTTLNVPAGERKRWS